MPSSTDNGNTQADETNGSQTNFDVIIVGGGFSGCYFLHKLRKLGFSVHLIEAGSALGGVWHWSRYPGARVDCEIPFYQSSIREVFRDWTWSQRFPDHNELRRYFAHVDKVLDLSRDVSYNTSVTGAQFKPEAGEWEFNTNTGRTFTSKFFVAATGSSYKPYQPDYPGLKDFQGQVVHSTSWPDAGIDVAGKKVAIIGAGSTGVQCTQNLSKRAAQTTVYIRQPNIALPMGQRDLSELEQGAQKALYGGIFAYLKSTMGGLPSDPEPIPWKETTLEQRAKLFEEQMARGGFNFLANGFPDYMVSDEVNSAMYDFWARKVRARISDTAKRDIVAPLKQPYPFGTKRSSLEQDYYECIDKESVDVVSLEKSPIREFTNEGIVTEDGKKRAHDFVVLATGYDSMTGSLTSMGLRGTDGVDMKEKWKNGVKTHLGLMVEGFPNMFMVYGPQAPTPYTNGPPFIEMQADLVIDFLAKLRDDKIASIEAKSENQERWGGIVQGISDMTVFKNATNSWYVGGNVPGKKREQLVYLGGMNNYADTVAKELGDYGLFNVVHEG